MTKGAYTSLDELIRLKFQGQGFSFLPRQPIHSLLAGRHASRLRGRGLNFEEIRVYQPGDDIRSIDWKVTARTRKPHCRVYTEERDRPALIVVDQRINMFFGSQRAMKSVTAAETAALAAWRVIGVGDRPGAVIFNDSEIVEIRPHRSQQRVLQILNSVLQQNLALRADSTVRSCPEQLNKALERVVRLATHDYLIVLISDLDGADEQTTRRLLTRLAQHNDVLVSLIYDPLETALPAHGRLVISNGELQLEFDSGDAMLRKRFAEVFSTRLERARQLLQRRQIPVLPLHTGLPVAEQVRKLLGYAAGTRRA